MTELRQCENPNGFPFSGCRALAVNHVQAGHMDETVEVEVDAHLCAYCTADFETAFREANPEGFVRNIA